MPANTKTSEDDSVQKAHDVLGQIETLFSTHEEAAQSGVGALEAAFNSRFDQTSDRIAKLTEAIHGQQKLLEVILETITAGSNPSDLPLSDFAKSILVEDGDAEASEIATPPEKKEAEESKAEESTKKDSARKDSGATSNWNLQKAEMLKSYGMELDESDKALLAAAEADQLEQDEVDVSETEQADDEVVETTAKVEEDGGEDDKDSEESSSVEQLKEDLKKKLRETEIELSIGRARISQQRAQLDEKLVELERLENKLNDEQDDDQEGDLDTKSKLLSRWARHLRIKKQKEL
jgi:hypothetical protein